MARFFKPIWLSLALAFTAMLILPFSGYVMASNTSQASYVATIRITNNSSSIAYNVSVPVTINTTAMIASNFMASNLSNTAMIDNFGNDTAYNPAVVTNTTWMFFVPMIPGNSQIDYQLYMGGPAMAGNKTLIAGTTGMTTADNASLELGNNFSITQTGFLDTSSGASKYLISKASALTLNVSAAGNLTLAVNGTTALTATNIGTGYHMVKVLDNGSSLVLRIDHNLIFNSSDVNLDGVVNATDSALVTQYIASGNPGSGAADYLQYLRCDVNLDGAVDATDLALVGAGFTRLYYDLNVDGVIDASDVAVISNYILGGTPLAIKIAGDFNNSGTISVGDEVVLANNYDAFITTSLGAATITNNANAWDFDNTGDTWSYLESQTIVINGTTRQSIGWQNAAIWTDASDNGNHATPTFRTTSTNANVSASMVDFQTSHEAILTDWSLSSYDSYVKDIPSMPSEMYQGVSPTFPGSAIPGEIETAGNLPTGLFWWLIPCLIVVMAGAILYDKTKSLAVQYVVVLLCILFLSLIHIWALWVIVPVILQGGAGTLAGKVYNY